MSQPQKFNESNKKKQDQQENKTELNINQDRDLTPLKIVDRDNKFVGNKITLCLVDGKNDTEPTQMSNSNQKLRKIISHGYLKTERSTSCHHRCYNINEALMNQSTKNTNCQKSHHSSKFIKDINKSKISRDGQTSVIDSSRCGVSQSLTSQDLKQYLNCAPKQNDQIRNNSNNQKTMNDSKVEKRYSKIELIAQSSKLSTSQSLKSLSNYTNTLNKQDKNSNHLQSKIECSDQLQSIATLNNKIQESLITMIEQNNQNQEITDNDSISNLNSTQCPQIQNQKIIQKGSQNKLKNYRQSINNLKKSIQKYTQIQNLNSQNQGKSQRDQNVRQSLQNIQPLNLNSRRSRDYKNIEVSKSENYEIIDQSSTSKLHQKQKSISNKDKNDLQNPNSKMLQQQSEKIKQKQQQIKQIYELRIEDQQNESSKNSSSKTLQEIQSLNNKIQVLTDEIQDMKKIQQNSLKIQQKLSQHNLVQNESQCSTNLGSPKVINLPKNNKFQSTDICQNVTNNQNYSQQQKNQRQGIEEKNQLTSQNAYYILRSGVRYLSMKSIHRVFNEICSFMSVHSNQLELEQINLPINKHVFIGHFLEVFIEVLQSEDNNLEIDQLRDDLKNFYKKVKSDGKIVTLGQIYLALIMNKYHKIESSLIKEIFIFLFKSERITNKQLEEFIKALSSVWLVFNQSSTIGIAITNMKMKIDDIAKILAEDISLMNNQNQILVETLNKWIIYGNQKERSKSIANKSNSINKHKFDKSVTNLKIQQLQSSIDLSLNHHSKSIQEPITAKSHSRIPSLNQRYQKSEIIYESNNKAFKQDYLDDMLIEENSDQCQQDEAMIQDEHNLSLLIDQHQEIGGGNIQLENLSSPSNYHSKSSLYKSQAPNKFINNLVLSQDKSLGISNIFQDQFQQQMYKDNQNKSQKQIELLKQRKLINSSQYCSDRKDNLMQPQILSQTIAGSHIKIPLLNLQQLKQNQDTHSSLQKELSAFQNNQNSHSVIQQNQMKVQANYQTQNYVQNQQNNTYRIPQQNIDQTPSLRMNIEELYNYQTQDPQIQHNQQQSLQQNTCYQLIHNHNPHSYQQCTNLIRNSANLNQVLLNQQQQNFNQQFHTNNQQISQCYHQCNLNDVTKYNQYQPPQNCISLQNQQFCCQSHQVCSCHSSCHRNHQNFNDYITQPSTFYSRINQSNSAQNNQLQDCLNRKYHLRNDNQQINNCYFTEIQDTHIDSCYSNNYLTFESNISLGKQYMNETNILRNLENNKTLSDTKRNTQIWQNSVRHQAEQNFKENSNNEQLRFKLNPISLNQQAINLSKNNQNQNPQYSHKSLTQRGSRQVANPQNLFEANYL